MHCCTLISDEIRYTPGRLIPEGYGKNIYGLSFVRTLHSLTILELARSQLVSRQTLVRWLKLFGSRVFNILYINRFDTARYIGEGSACCQLLGLVLRRFHS